MKTAAAFVHSTGHFLPPMFALILSLAIDGENDARILECSISFSFHLTSIDTAVPDSVVDTSLVLLEEIVMPLKCSQHRPAPQNVEQFASSITLSLGDIVSIQASRCSR